jgi:hypothetical protein
LHVSDYCRAIETYLCQKNDGHLIRVVGPSFDLVSSWAAAGLPLKIAFRGIDRYFERYYRKGPRRRPVRIDFCEPDVLDAFDEWRRAVGLAGEWNPREHDAAPTAGSGSGEEAHASPAGQRIRGAPVSLPAHLERALLRLTDARTSGFLGPSADALIDKVSRELDTARGSARGLRGEARRACLERLAELDAELLDVARSGLEESARMALDREADEELSPFSERLTKEAYAAARGAASARLLRERLALPMLRVV